MEDLRLIEPPAAEPVTLAEANFHLRLVADPTDTSEQPEDGLVSTLIIAAREVASEFLNRPVADGLYELRRCRFDGPLPSPAREVVSVVYVADDGTSTTVDPAVWELAGPLTRPRLRERWGQVWPTDVRERDDSIVITFRGGFGDGYPMPVIIKQAILLIVGHLYENREGQQIPDGVFHLLQPHRLGMGV